MIDYLINFYYCSDLIQTQKFYQEILGFELFKDQGQCHIYRKNNYYLGFCQHLEPRSSKKDLIITFVCSDIERKYAELKAITNIVVPLKVNEYFKIKHFYLLDPNGYYLEFQQFID